MSEYTKPACRGSWSLGTACGKCERCLATRPQPSAEPVAWKYSQASVATVHLHPCPDNVRQGWTETPLYPASALEAARREALEQAAKLLEEHAAALKKLRAEYSHKAIDGLADQVRALKENSNG